MTAYNILSASQLDEVEKTSTACCKISTIDLKLVFRVGWKFVLEKNGEKWLADMFKIDVFTIDLDFQVQYYIKKLPFDNSEIKGVKLSRAG